MPAKRQLNMSQREFLIVLAHAHVCGACRDKLLARPEAVFAGRALTQDEKQRLTNLQFADFITPEKLARAAGSEPAELDAFRDQPIVRLRHL